MKIFSWVDFDLSNTQAWVRNRTPHLINFFSCSTEFLPFPGLWLGEQFLCICWQPAHLIDIKLAVNSSIVLPRSDYSQISVRLCWIPTIAWPLIGQAVSAHLQTNMKIANLEFLLMNTVAEIILILLDVELNCFQMIQLMIVGEGHHWLR